METMSEKKRYTAHARRSGGWWAIDVPEVRGVFTQARRLEQVEGTAREAIALMLDIAPDSLDVVLDVELLDRLAATVEDAKTQRREAEERMRSASEAMRDAAVALKAEGLPDRDVGRVLGVSYQRVAQLRSPRHPTRRKQPA